MIGCALLAALCLVWSLFIGFAGGTGVYREIGGARLDTIMFSVFAVLQIVGYLLAAAAILITANRG